MPSDGEAEHPARSGDCRGFLSVITEPQGHLGCPSTPTGLQKEKAALGSSHHRQLFVTSWAKPPLKGRETSLLHKPHRVDFCLLELFKMKKLHSVQSGVDFCLLELLKMKKLHCPVWCGTAGAGCDTTDSSWSLPGAPGSLRLCLRIKCEF